jgi:cytochrome P450
MSECPFHAPSAQSFTQPQAQRDPFPLVDQLLRAEQPITQDPITGMYVVSRWADADYIFSRPEQFSSKIDFMLFRDNSPLWPEMKRIYEEEGWLPQHTLVTNDDPDHARLRKLVDRIFTAKKVRELEPGITAIVDQVIDELVPERGANLVPRLSVTVPLNVISWQLGIAPEERHLLKEWGDITIERFDPLIDPQRELAITRRTVFMQQYVMNKARQLQAAPDGTLFSDIVHAEVDGERLPPRTLIAIMQQLLVAGHETTTSALSTAIMLLLDNPDVRARLAAEPALIANFVEEVLRLHPPVLQSYRIVREDTDVHGVKLPQGAMILISQICGNYDPAKWEQPAALDLSRANVRSHLAFGRGKHYCIGNILARTEIRIVIERLLARMPQLRFDPDQPRPQWALCFHTHLLDQLWTKW